jgi:hypothetical protein
VISELRVTSKHRTDLLVLGTGSVSEFYVDNSALSYSKREPMTFVRHNQRLVTCN